MKKTIVGITGIIGSGKSTVANYLIKLGYEVIDTDKISRTLTKRDTKGYNLIIKHFPNILDNSLNIDRKQLGQIVFSDEEKRILLNGLLHPLIKENVINQINKSNDNLIFLDVPLLFESGFDSLCDYTICVKASTSNIINRVVKRDNISKDVILKIIDSQMPMDNKINLSDFVLDNDNDISRLEEQVKEILVKIKE